MMLEYLKVTSLDIQPEELELRRENGNNTKRFFRSRHLDEYNKFQIDLFDKRDSFPFSIIKTPEKSSNVPSNIF